MQLLPALRIFAFEPVSETFEILRRETRRWPNVAVYPYAMGDAAGSAEIHLHDLSVMNSLVGGPGATGATETVEIRTVDGMMRELGLDFIHFLKIDTEGFESQVLAGAAEALAEGRIGILQAEFHLIEAEGLQRIHSLLAPQGYELQGLYNQNREPLSETAPWPHADTAGFTRGRLAYADAVYAYTGRRSSSATLPLL